MRSLQQRRVLIVDFAHPLDSQCSRGLAKGVAAAYEANASTAFVHCFGWRNVSGRAYVCA
jgi:hypothetical protein